MEESGIDLNFDDLMKYIDGDTNYEEFLHQPSEHFLSPQDDLPYYELKSKAVDSSSPPTFKTATPTTRTHIKQLLMKEKSLEDAKREEEEKRKLSQLTNKQQRIESHETQDKSTQKFMKVPHNVKVHLDVPSQVLQVKTSLENPTQYHVKQKQRMQLRQYVDEMRQMQRSPLDSSVPPTQCTSLPLSHAPHPAGQYSSVPAVVAPTPLPSPMSPGLSSVATSNSEAEDLLDELNFASLNSDHIKTATSLTLPDEVEGASGMFLDHLIALGSTGSTSAGLGKTSQSCPADISQMKPDHLYSEADLLAIKDRQKKDNHNMIERRRRFNINDRIKELGALLPKNNDPHFEIVRDVRQNKGAILKMSVSYIKTLQGDLRDSKKIGDQLITQNRALILRVQELEQHLAKVSGLERSDVPWHSPSPVTTLNSYVKPHRMLNTALSDSIADDSPLSLSEDLMDDDHPVTGDPMLSTPHHLLLSPSPSPPPSSVLSHLDDMDIGL